MRKISFALIGCFIAVCTHAAQIVNVDYIHKLITQEWDITVPIKTDNITAAANMKYLLTAVDVANEILNGEKTTDYGNTKFATTQAVDTIATNQAVNTLIKQNKIEYKFSATIDLSRYDDNSGWVAGMPVTEFGFSISAAGTFYIDWGDGTVETIKKDNTEYIEYTHDYGTTDGVYTVQIGGRATDYSDDMAAIDFTTTLGPHSYSSQALTDINGSLGAIFGTLPDGTQPKFTGTFSYAQGLQKIPTNLFDGIYGDLVDNMFVGTFEYCGSLTGPSARINGQYLYEIWPDATEDQVGYMYAYSSDLSDFACIPVVWGGGGINCSASGLSPVFALTTTSDTSSFEFSISAAGKFFVDWGDGTVETITKSNTTNTTYSHNYDTAGAYTIGIGGQAIEYNNDTSTAAISFYVGANYSTQMTNVQKIASIDGSLGAIFRTLSRDTQKQPRFYHTFYGASNMTGSIPENLFAGISGAPANYMFYYTFGGCSGLTGAIPDGLFAGISGAPADYMFCRTFYGCSGLTSIPENLFAGISGAPAYGMFSGTFYGCSGLTSIPENLFGNISGKAQILMFNQTFYNCGLLTGPSARINGKYLYEIWPDATTDLVGNMYYHAKKLDDYRCIPTVWGGAGENCSAPTAEFTLTTMPDARDFSFYISAAGEFTVDWGDGTIETINKTNTDNKMYHHAYGTAGAYTIGLSGQATRYPDLFGIAAISFNTSSVYNTQKIASIDGSLGAIFGTLPNGDTPSFEKTFYNASNMTGSIPEKLFENISGSISSDTFYGTFAGCTSLTGPSARINGQYLYEIWPDLTFTIGTAAQIGPYYQCTGLSDYNLMPNIWKDYIEYSDDF